MKARLIPVYILLIAGALAFLLPLVWMLSTALKTPDQTMSVPPVWVPTRSTIERGGQTVEVMRLSTIAEPSQLVRFGADAALSVVPAGSVQNGIWRDARGFPTEATVTKEIPATTKEPWVLIADRAYSWSDAIPEREMTTRISLRWQNFPEAVHAMGHFPRYLSNTLLLCVLNTVGTLLSCSLVAYGFSCIHWRGRETMFFLVLGTMMIPFPVVMVPLYALYRSLGMIGTLQPLWVGAFFANAFNIFLLRQFFRGIPSSLIEAAGIDGCSEFRIYWNVVLPLCRPVLTVVAIFTLLGTWNDFLGPLVFLTDEKDYTLMLGLQKYQSQSGGTEWQYLMAASALITAPVILLFLLAQKTFIEGVALTGSKE